MCRAAAQNIGLKNVQNKIILKFLLAATIAATLSACNSLPARRADSVLVKTVTHGTLPVRREMARSLSHALQCAIGTRRNCDDYQQPNDQAGNEYGN